MRFKKENTEASLGPLALLLTAGGMEHGLDLEVQASKDTAVILKKEMCALELVQTIRDLSDLSKNLLAHLVKVCGPCGHCMDRCSRMGKEEPVQIPEVLLKRAGISKDAKLDVLSGDGEIYIAEAAGPDLRDVPQEMLELFRQTGICLGALEELLMEGDIVYGD